MLLGLCALLNEVGEFVCVVSGLLQYGVKLLEIIIGFELGETLNSVDARRNGTHNFVSRRDRGICDVLVLKLHCVAESFAVGVFNKTFVCPVMFRRGVQIPTID